MIIRGRSSLERLREWRTQTRLRTVIERKAQGAIRREISRAVRAAMDEFEATGAVAVALADHEERMAKAMRPMYQRAIKVFGERTMGAAKSMGSLEFKAPQDSFLRAAESWLLRYGADHVQKVAATTQAQINTALVSGLASNTSRRDIAQSIVRHTGGDIARLRATVIAQTETHAAAEAANMMAVDAIGSDVLVREWVAAQDERTRETHKAASGQTIQQGEAFTVGAAKLQHPGDPAGPPEEIINCRCVAVAVLNE